MTHLHPGVELRANLKSIFYRCHLFEVALVWELTNETIYLPLGCLQGGGQSELASCKDPTSTAKFPSYHIGSTFFFFFITLKPRGE